VSPSDGRTPAAANSQDGLIIFCPACDRMRVAKAVKNENQFLYIFAYINMYNKPGGAGTWEGAASRS
jgi:hypothetical protein